MAFSRVGMGICSLKRYYVPFILQPLDFNYSQFELVKLPLPPESSALNSVSNSSLWLDTI